VERLLTSLNLPTQREIDELCAGEAERRVAQIDRGEVDLVPGEKVFEKIRKSALPSSARFPPTLFTLWLSFNDGTEGIVDLEDSLWGPVFEPLKNVDAFRQVSVSSTLRTVAWPNDADFAPEFLREKPIEQKR